MEIPLFGRPKTDPVVAARVKDWVRAALRLPADTAVMVTELRCAEPGCPEVETVIALPMADRMHQFKVARPLADLTPADLASLSLTEEPAS